MDDVSFGWMMVDQGGTPSPPPIETLLISIDNEFFVDDQGNTFEVAD